MSQSKNTIDVETLIAAALQHGLDSEPDDEAGDLQDYFRAGWAILEVDQRKAMLKQPRLKSALETATGKKLQMTEKLLTSKGVEKILDIFQEHGNDEVPEAEISDLQDALRSCWDVLKPEQRTELLGLDEVQETYENATTKPLFRYLVSTGWEHIFVGTRAETTRWVYDRHEEKLLAGQVLNGSVWVNLDVVPMADLLQDIHDNDAELAPEEWDLIKFGHVPTWDDVDEAFKQLEADNQATKALPVERG